MNAVAIADILVKKESSIQNAVCAFLRAQYPDIIFTSESSGVRLTIGQAKQAKHLRSGNKLPDLIILEPRGNYHGLCLELKSKNPFKKNGEIKSDEHLQGQHQMIGRLRTKGYSADFATGFDEAIEKIKIYMESL